MPDRQSLIDTLRAEVRRTRGGAAFSDLLKRLPALDDDTLADLIEADGRARIDVGARVDLDDYLHAVPDLPGRPDALDAALDVVLRARSGASRPPPDVVDGLIASHPRLEAEIRDAAALNNAFWSTQTLRRGVAPAVTRAVPCDFGPEMPDGRRRYELRRSLGAGSFGEVFLALDRRLSDDRSEAYVAIKVLRTRDRSPGARRRLIEEAVKARRVDHRNAVRVLDRDVSDQDEDYIVHEYVDGGSLASRIDPRKEPVPVRRAAELVRDVARGMQAVHAASLIHCDLKPANILITADGSPKVADFGVAIRSGESPDQYEDATTEGKHRVGNLAFMSPEQFRAESGAFTVRADVYALGGILYWLLTGALPNGDTLKEVERSHHGGGRAPPSPRAIRSEVDNDLDAICRRAMATDPDARYDAAGMLADDLDAWLHRVPIRWTRPSPARVFTLWTKRKPLAAALMGAVALSVVVGALIAWRYATIAQQEAHERQLAQVRLEDEKRWKEGIANLLGAMRVTSVRAQNRGLLSEFMTGLWMMEWVFGPNFVDYPDGVEAVWDMRIDVARTLVGDYRKVGGERSLPTLIWETSLAYWLTIKGDHAESEPILARLRDAWRDRLDPTDPWLGAVDAISAMAAVNRLEALGAGDTVEARYVERTLLAHNELLRQLSDGANLRYHMLHSLARLYGPTLLNRPDETQRMIAAAVALDVSAPVPTAHPAPTASTTGATNDD